MLILWGQEGGRGTGIMDFIFWDGWFRLGIVDRHWGGGSGTDMGDVYSMGMQLESFGTDIGDFNILVAWGCNWLARCRHSRPSLGQRLGMSIL